MAELETKILILCNPSNPAAAILSRSRDSDEIYEQIVFQDEGVPERVCKNFAMITSGQTTSCANSVGQFMAIEAMKLELASIDKGEVRIAKDLHGLDLKRQYVVKRLRAIRFAYQMSSFFVFMDVALYFNGKKASPGSDKEESLGIRISYAGPVDTMVHAMDGLESALNSLNV
ncbi:hypothetical protein JG688_00007429 [Phytophthora aleatoria]|uniref:Uncharacterized protein n=1 Tax=Phytophthora aleatoria TaxID=2496075 RepID=A0A8J5MGG1_9STRA|nr:hypothetical protein JG688_00007429 [Phytophthora aleatoria]